MLFGNPCYILKDTVVFIINRFVSILTVSVLQVNQSCIRAGCTAGRYSQMKEHQDFWSILGKWRSIKMSDQIYRKFGMKIWWLLSKQRSRAVDQNGSLATEGGYISVDGGWIWQQSNSPRPKLVNIWCKWNCGKHWICCPLFIALSNIFVHSKYSLLEFGSSVYSNDPALTFTFMFQLL